MLMYHWSRRSYRNLQQVRPELVAVATVALMDLAESGGPDFVVTDGVRSVDQQRKLVEEGKSQTMNSRHLTGHAIDIAAFTDDYEVTWEPRPYERIAEAMKWAGERMGVEIEWGGDWTSFVDRPHFQLSRAQYPAPEALDRNTE